MGTSLPFSIFVTRWEKKGFDLIDFHIKNTKSDGLTIITKEYKEEERDWTKSLLPFSTSIVK